MNVSSSPSATASEPAVTSYRAPAFADFRPEHAAPGATPERLAHLEEHSFVIINDFVGNPWIPVLREAGRRVTEACQAENGYGKLDVSKGYIHRTKDDEPWALRVVIEGDFKFRHDRKGDRGGR